MHELYTQLELPTRKSYLPILDQQQFLPEDSVLALCGNKRKHISNTIKIYTMRFIRLYSAISLRSADPAISAKKGFCFKYFQCKIFINREQYFYWTRHK